MAYDDEFKRQVINDALETNCTASSRKHNVSDKTIRGWVKKHQQRQEFKETIAPHIKPTTGVYADRFELPPLGLTICVIPDVQAKDGLDFTYLGYLGRYIAEKKPDVIVCIGDFADMPSLSTYEQAGSKGYEGQRYRHDILATHHAMKALMTPIKEAMKGDWKPRLVMTLGNHEHRIDRAIEATPKLDGVIGLPDLEYDRWGWEAVPFLEPIVIGGIAFCHYFCSGVMGRPVTTARMLLAKKHMSCFAGHQQGRDIAYGYRGDGTEIIGIISGSCYLHDEGYLNHQTNKHFRGFYFLHDVVDGTFEEMPVSLKYLMRRYS